MYLCTQNNEYNIENSNKYHSFMTNIALHNLWNYINSMSLSNRNKQWLADKLIESKKESKREMQQRYVRESLTKSFQELKEARLSGKELQSADDFLKEMEQW